MSVVVGERDQAVQQQVGSCGLVRWSARHGSGGPCDLGHADGVVEPGAEQRRGECVEVRLARELDIQRLETSGGCE